jgi:flagellin
MKLSLGNNIASLGIQRALAEHTGRMGSITQRLASAQRINRASDDAAGLSISSALNTDIRVLTQGVRNVNDAISLLNIRSAALGELKNISLRQRELAAQASNELYGVQQRSAMQKEIDALTDEYNRIVSSVSYNGLNLLDNSFRQLNIQGGYGEQGVLSVMLNQQLQRLAGTGSFEEAVAYNTGLAPGQIAYGDFNGNGLLDLAIAKGGGDSIAVILNNGDGTFSAPTFFATDDLPSAIMAVDINNDGVLDLVTRDYGADGLGETLSILFGNGDGTFADAITVPTAPGQTALAVGDLNNDSFLDLITATGAVNFPAGTGEVTRVTAPTNGRIEITDITFVDLAIQQLTQIIAGIASSGAYEETEITVVGTSEREVIDITAASAASGTSEETTITAVATAYDEQTEITATGADDGVAEETTITAIATAYDEQSEITATGADDGVAEVRTITAIASAYKEKTDITTIATARQEVTDITLESGAKYRGWQLL